MDKVVSILTSTLYKLYYFNIGKNTALEASK